MTTRHTVIVVVMQVMMIIILLYQIYDLHRIAERSREMRIEFCQQIMKVMPEVDCSGLWNGGSN